MANSRGRSAQTGDRYPSGKLKNNISPPAILRRVRTMAMTGAADPNLGSSFGWLYLHNSLGSDASIASARATAGFAYARAMGEYAAMMGFPRRHAASPAYVRSYRATEEAPADTPASKPRADLTDEQIRQRRARMRELTDRIVALDGRGRALRLLDSVVVDNDMPTTSDMALLLRALDVLVDHYGFSQPLRRRA